MNELKLLFDRLDEIEDKSKLIEITKKEIAFLEHTNPANKKLKELYKEIVSELLNFGQIEDARVYVDKGEKKGFGDAVWGRYGNYFRDEHLKGIDIDCNNIHIFSEVFSAYQNAAKFNGAFGNYMLGTFFEQRNNKDYALKYYSKSTKSEGCSVFKLLAEERLQILKGFF